MVAQTQFDPQNANALFSPDQWLNQFSNFNNAALPWPSSYVGTPTDAMGKPIQPPPGMTLNSPPAAPPQAAAPQVPQFLQTAGGTISGGSTARNMGVSDGNVPGGYVVNPAYVQQQQQAAGAPSTASAGQGGGGMTMQQMLASFTPIQQQWWAGAPASEKQQAMNTYGVGAAAPQAAPQAAPNSWQNTMAMLANPGKVTTPGATVPAGPSAQPSSGALQAFLQNYKPTQSGPGSQFQQGFANTLKGMGY